MNQPIDWLLIRGGRNFRLGSGFSEEKEDELFQMLCKFINSNGLGHMKMPEQAEQDWEGFEIRKSHLTDLGQAVMKDSFRRWLSAIDRGTKPSKSKILSVALEKLRGSSS